MSKLHNHIFQSMNMVALRHIDGDRFEVVTPAGAWFAELWPSAFKPEPLAIRGPSPFLDNFLNDAAMHWSSSEKSENLRSGPFIEEASVSGTIPLEATAFLSNNERILIVTNLGESYQETLKLLQAARENLLTQESLEVEVSKRTTEIRAREGEIASRLIYAAGFRDEETGEHIRRIGLYSAEMARALGWSQTAIDDIRVAAPMHDIGKIGIEDEILKKPGKLTEIEFTRMKQHASIGEAMLDGSDIPMILMAADIAGAHHENFDGTGYPRGIKGDQIPTSARIVAIVDVYDALVHQRVYKPAMDEDEALALMRGLSGSKFDVELFELFCANLTAMRAIREKLIDER